MIFSCRQLDVVVAVARAMSTPGPSSLSSAIDSCDASDAAANRSIRMTLGQVQHILETHIVPFGKALSDLNVGALLNSFDSVLPEHIREQKRLSFDYDVVIPADEEYPCGPSQATKITFYPRPNRSNEDAGLKSIVLRRCYDLKYWYPKKHDQNMHNILRWLKLTLNQAQPWVSKVCEEAEQKGVHPKIVERACEFALLLFQRRLLQSIVTGASQGGRCRAIQRPNNDNTTIEYASWFDPMVHIDGGNIIDDNALQKKKADPMELARKIEHHVPGFSSDDNCRLLLALVKAATTCPTPQPPSKVMEQHNTKKKQAVKILRQRRVENMEMSRTEADEWTPADSEIWASQPDPIRIWLDTTKRKSNKGVDIFKRLLHELGRSTANIDEICHTFQYSPLADSHEDDQNELFQQLTNSGWLRRR